MLKIILGDCLEKLQDVKDNTVDSIVTDPPYGLSFMGKRWDYAVPSVAIWEQCLRVLKPGGHLLAFAGTRTQHRMAVRIEDAGFEIRDMIAWVYGSGFPKSLDVSKAIDKAAGAERDVIGPPTPGGQGNGNVYGAITRPPATAPATEAAKQWAGWGTALKPSLEPITVARKPLRGTVAENVLQYGTGGLNVDGCRVGTEVPQPRNAPKKIMRGGNFHAAANTETEMSHYNPTQGRWPANLIHDGSDEVVRSLGDASRFFYCPKTSKKDRGETNKHPTVKPTDLMRYLIRLVTPPKGIVLDPFMGSGSTGKACVLEKMNFIGIELNKEYYAEARKRIIAAKGKS